MADIPLVVVELVKSSLASILASFRGDGAGRSVLPFIPRPVRAAFVLLLILNARSLPFAWHIRVFRPLLIARLKWAWLRLTFASPRRKAAFLSSLSSAGKSPFELRTTYTSWVSPDDTDYNIHLSNSCYSKLLDMVRMEFALSHLTPTFRAGCWIALGATHARFIKEIPMGRSYEVRVYTGAWDEKWVYVISRFVSKNPKSKVSARKKAPDARETPDSSPKAVPFPDMHTPASGDVSIAPSGTSTPNPALLRPTPSDASAASEQLKTALSAAECAWPEAEDETLHCVVVNEMCFKHGRITVPPTLALALSGCGSRADDEPWERVEAMRGGGRSGSGKSTEAIKSGERSMPPLKDLLRGAWKDVPQSERWWEQALAPYEAENARRLGVLRALREGLASVPEL